jgi:HNH endonuclease
MSRKDMLVPGEVLSYLEMCAAEGVSLQRGMNFRAADGNSVVLMSLRPGAPYADRIEDSGHTLIYEGHDAPRRPGGPDPKAVDQPKVTPSGTTTANGLFAEAALKYKRGESDAERVRVYEKIRSGIWVYNGLFNLVDVWTEQSGGRSVFKFRLELREQVGDTFSASRPRALQQTRLIPTAIKLEVWKRDQGRCTRCGSIDNLHFDHVIPYSKGGSSLVAANIQLLCAKHNLEKRDQLV